MTFNKFAIKDHMIGDKRPSFIIAEVAQAHDGSLGMAHSYIDAAASAGVDAIKFQTHIADAESTLDEPFRIRFSLQDETRYQYWKRMEFSLEQWQGLASHASDKGLIFLSSPFSVAAVELLQKLDIPAWKIGSGETVSGDIFEALIEIGKPLLISTGMSTYKEIENIVNRLKKSGIAFGLFQCTSRYPVDNREIGLNVIDEMKRRFGCPVGLSDHSGTVYPALAAIARQADMIEAHIVFDRSMFGPDAKSSLTVAEFRHLVHARGAFFEMDSNPVDKDKMAEDMDEMRKTFGKSLALKTNLAAGNCISADLLTSKKPDSGISITEKEQIIGKRLKRDVSSNRVLCWEDIDDRS